MGINDQHEPAPIMPVRGLLRLTREPLTRRYDLPQTGDAELVLSRLPIPVLGRRRSDAPSQ